MDRIKKIRRLAPAVAALLILPVTGTPARGATNDPYFGQQWPLSRIKAEPAWARSTGSGVTIAVIDTGIDLSHEDLAQNVVAGTNILRCGRRAKNCNTTGRDDHGHGTHVAGIAAAVTGNGRGIAGVAPGARLMPVKVLDGNGEGTVEDIAAGIRYAADHGADVLNLSLGVMSGVSQIGSTLGWWVPIDEAIDHAWSRGAVVVVAAGNDSFPLCAEPAAHEHAVCVGATDHNDAIATYSNSGDVDVVAPGGLGSVFCEHSSVDVLSTIWPGSNLDCQGGTARTGYETLAGTSMAAPHVSGVAALLLARGLTNAQAVERIKATADDLGAPGRDPVYGSGRVNALRAVS